MKSSDRTIMISLLVVGLVAAFWFLVIAPKREEATALDEDIATLQETVAAQEQLAVYAESAEGDYKQNYHRLVVLGKAVPGDDDSASLIQQMQTLADRAGLDFRKIALARSGEAVTATVPAAETPAETPEGESEGGDSEEGVPADDGATPATVAPTEAAAATLPIGATVGPAGLPVMPYDLDFRGSFFEFADFLADLDSMVSTESKGVGVNGRLLTVDGFVFAGDQTKGFPFLNTSLRVTSYVAPADQGLTGGATAAAPPATTPATPTPTSSTTGTVTP